MTQLLAMDKSMRSRDTFGRLHVEKSNISKAAVNPYYGREIPNAAALGLDLDTIYYLLRCPEELARGAATFNNIQILWRHDGTLKATTPLKDLVVGTTGTNAVFDEPYLQNGLSIWDADAILAIEQHVQKELSSAYSYDADMTPGSYCGVKYDGVMRNIRGNHVALVTEGRAGPDVVVGDSKLLENPKMKLSTKGVALLGALTGYSASVIAQDAQIGDLRAIVGRVKDLSTAKERKAVVTAFTKAVAGKLATGMALDGLDDVVDAVAEADTDEDPPKPGAMDGDDFGSQLQALLTANGMTPEVITQIQALCSGGAMDEDPDKEKDDDVKDKPAMDAAMVQTAIDAATSATRNALLAVRNAEIEVQPVIGNLAVAMDNAADVYKMALTQMGADLTDVDPSAFRPMFRALRANVPVVTSTRVIAQDSAMAGAKTFADYFPGANRVGAA